MTKPIAKISLLTNDLNFNATTLDAAVDKVNLTYISKFGLFLSIAQNINSCLIFNNIYINNPIIASNIKFNLWVFNCFESYQLSPSLVIYMMLEVFCNEFYK